jgi:hypothetical protein
VGGSRHGRGGALGGAGRILASFGGFNFVRRHGGPHSLLRLHQIRSGVADLLPDDGAWIDRGGRCWF